MHEAVTTALDAAFPERSVARLTGAGPSWNGANETVGVVFADGERAFCKVAVDGDGTRIARELAVVRHLNETRAIEAPAVLAADADGSTPFLVTAPVPGRELHDVWTERGSESQGDDGGPANGETGNDRRREALLRRVGATLATLHAERFDSAAEITGGQPDGTLALDRAPWPDVLSETIGRTREIGTSERLAWHYDAVVDCVESNRDRLGDAPAALLHGDVAMPNLFVADAADDADPEAALAGGDDLVPIDWELAHVGDPVRDLVRAEDQLVNGFDERGPKRYAEAIRDGYRQRAGGLPPGYAARKPIYDVVRMLGRSGFVDQWTTYLDEPTADLVDRANAELRARLDRI